jgi:hypothetical protein
MYLEADLVGRRQTNANEEILKGKAGTKSSAETGYRVRERLPTIGTADFCSGFFFLALLILSLISPLLALCDSAPATAIRLCASPAFSQFALFLCY